MRRLWRLGWLVMAVGLVLAGLMALILQLVILPRIDSFRPDLERLASRTLGLPVHIGQLVVTRPGWEPEIEMRDVVLRDASGADSLRIQTIQAVVSLQAITHAGFERLSIIAPALQARRNADGSLEVAGTRLTEGKGGDSGPLLNWLLSQPELAIRNGSVRWLDLQRGVPALQLDEMQASLRNSGTQHTLEVTVRPPAGWGEPFRLVGEWSHPLLGDRTLWRDWVGAGYAEWPRLDVSQLRRYMDLGEHIDLRQGRGSVRLWGDFNRMRNSTLTAEVRLDAVDATLGKDLPPLALKNLETMFSAQFASDGDKRDTYTLATQTLGFTTMSERTWPGGNVRVEVVNGTQGPDSSGTVEGGKWDLGIIGELATRLPLGEAMHNALLTYQPAGRMEKLEVSWKGNINQPDSYAVKGEANRIGWLSRQGPFNRQIGRFEPGVPGVEGAAVKFDLTHKGGHMNIAMQDGVVVLPGVFEEPRLPFARFDAGVDWQIDGTTIKAQLPDVRFANADAKGRLKAEWHTSEVQGDDLANRFPGVLDLQATLESARADRVHRYLPLSLGEVARRYVREAVRDGDIRNAKVRIEGDLAHIPYGKDKEGRPLPGIFRFEVPLINAHYAFLPVSFQKSGEKPWPALTHLNGRLIIDRHTLQIVDATGRFSTAPELKISELAAVIPDLSRNLTVGVAAKASGPLQQALQLANTSPLTDIANDALQKATATGNTDLTLALGIPVHDIRHIKVQGQLAFKGNDVRITPATPLLGQAQGEAHFSEAGFELRQVRAQMLGGQASIDGGMLPPQKPGLPKRVIFHALGDFSSDGLRGEKGVALIGPLAQYMQGRSRYKATLQFDRGAPELTIDSDLNGMALNLPAPLVNPAAGALPLHLENTIVNSAMDARKGGMVPSQDRLLLRIGQVVSVEYLRDVHQQGAPRVLRGSIAVGQQAHDNLPPLPDSGVHALVQLDEVSVDAWRKVLEAVGGKLGQEAPAAGPAAAGNVASALGYLPSVLAIQSRALVIGDRRIEDLVIGGTREGRLWKFTLDSRQLNGYVEYLQPEGKGSAGGIKARLARLVVEPANVQDVKDIVQKTQDPETLPALDITAENVDVLGYRFDRLVLLASNSATAPQTDAPLTDEGEDSRNAWRIHQLEATAPHGRLLGSGVWGRPNPRPDATPDQQRRFVALNVRLETDNLGALLEHFGQKDMISNGAGALSGRIRWRGSPIALDMETLGGNVRLDVRNGSIVKIDPGAAARMVSLLSLKGLSSTGKGKGFGFERINGTLRLSKGVGHSDDLSVTGSIADVKATGDVDFRQQTMALDVVVQPKIDLGGAALVATAINPMLGVGSYFAQLVLSKSINNAATQVLHVAGPWNKPQVDKLKDAAARDTALRVLEAQRRPQSVDRLWDWWPVTGGPGGHSPYMELPAVPKRRVPENATSQNGAEHEPGAD